MSLGVRLTSDRGKYGLAASCTFVCHVVGHPWHVYDGVRRDPQALRGRVSSNAQGNRGRSGPISDGRTPEKQAPAHPAAATMPARNAGRAAPGKSAAGKSPRAFKPRIATHGTPAKQAPVHPAAAKAAASAKRKKRTQRTGVNSHTNTWKGAKCTVTNRPEGNARGTVAFSYAGTAFQTRAASAGNSSAAPMSSA